MAALDDRQILETVESLLGKGSQVLDVQKTTTVREEEVVLVNGTPVVLSGPEGETIKNCLMSGTVPPPELLQQLLRRAGLLMTPVRVESSLTVKQTTVNKDTVTVTRNGVVVDERCKEVKEEDVLTSSASDVWRALPTEMNAIRVSEETSPTIFGTVASSTTPKNNVNRRSLPQTHQTGKAIGNIPCGSSDGMSSHNSSLETVESTESPEPDNSLVYRDTDLISGSLEALIQHLVPTVAYYPDRTYIFAFLLSSRLFIKPHALLGEVVRLSWVQQRLNDPAANKNHLGRFCYNLIQILGEWMDTFPYDFRDERVMAHVRNITQRCVTLDATLRRDVSTMLHNLLHKLTELEKYEEFLEKISIEAGAALIDHAAINDVTEVTGNPLELAQQLTHIELERLSFIGPEEFVQAFAKENPSIETSFKDMKKTKNLESYIQWFNRLSFMVATQVLMQHQKKKQRVRLIEFWIEVAKECFNIGNFNSLMAIIAGLNMSPVARLKKTWAKVQTAQFSVLEHQMDPSCNFTSYRSTLKAAMWRSAGAKDERQKIVIPFFSLLVKDLYFLNEGCANRLPNGHINFEKFWQLAKQVTEFMTWKQVACPFEKKSRVLHYMQTGPVCTENELGLMSFDCEPPDNNMEKERCKYLKSGTPVKS